MMQKMIYYFHQLYGYIVFHKRVYIHGMFSVGDTRNVSIGDGCAINHGVFILGRYRITIGNQVVLSARCMLLDSGLSLELPGRPHHDGEIVIEDGAWIGAGAIVLAGVRVGQNAVVGAGSVVTRDVSANTVVGGNPARVIRLIQ